jgi:hypothetical protein
MTGVTPYEVPPVLRLLAQKYAYPTPREHGFKAFGTGHTLSYNMYLSGSLSWQEWNDGWYAAQRAYQQQYIL